MTSLKHLGLVAVTVAVRDQHAGLVAALRRCFQRAGHQRCRRLFARNLLAHVPKPRSTTSPQRNILAHPKPDEVHAVWKKTREEFAARFPKRSPLMDEARTDVLAFTASPRFVHARPGGHRIARKGQRGRA